jgi:hypothetical protein
MRDTNKSGEVYARDVGKSMGEAVGSESVAKADKRIGGGEFIKLAAPDSFGQMR